MCGPRIRPDSGGMSFRFVAALIGAAALALPLSQQASAAGGTYTVTGGTPAEQATVHAALNASSFNWSLLPQTIQVTIEPGAGDYATPGKVSIDPQLLDMGTFAWAVVQHEFAHQIDFLLLTDPERAQLAQAIGGAQWFPSGAPLPHASYSCERFASLVAWAYWSSSQNSLRPNSATDEAGGMPAPAFRALLSQMLNIPVTQAASPPTVKVFAPKLKRTTLKRSSAA
jgi:hypothetical protein